MLLISLTHNILTPPSFKYYRDFFGDGETVGSDGAFHGTDDATEAFLSLIKAEDSHVAAIFAGHLHYDHAGEFECSILMSLYPDAVKLERLPDIKHWFTESAYNANKELGDKMVELSLEYLEKKIV